MSGNSSSDAYSTEFEVSEILSPSFVTNQNGGESCTLSLKSSIGHENSSGSNVSFIETNISYSQTTTGEGSKESFSAEESVSESFEAEEARSNFITRKLTILQSRSDVNGISPETCQSNKESQENEINTASYFKEKIEQLKRNTEKQLAIEMKQVSTLSCKAIDDTTVTCSALDKLKIENMLHELKEANTKEIHDPRKCLKCRRKQAELNKQEFIRRKRFIAEEPEFSRRLEQHLYFRDSATLLAQIISDS